MSNALSLRRTRISLATGAGEGRSGLGWPGAVVLHLLIVAATLFTWPHALEIAQSNPEIVPVDLVTLADSTNVAPVERAPPKIEPSTSLAALAPDTPPAPAIDTEPAPEEVVPAKKPEPAPVPTPPVPTPKTQADKKKPAQDDFTKLLDNLTQDKPQPNAKQGSRTVKGLGAQTAMTADLKSLLQSLIDPCWNRPDAVPHPEQLIVNMRIFLNPDGSVAQSPQVLGDSGSGNPYWGAAVDAARRAVYVCAPYKLPADRYGQWRDFTITFDPRKSAGVQ